MCPPPSTRSTDPERHQPIPNKVILLSPFSRGTTIPNIKGMKSLTIVAVLNVLILIAFHIEKKLRTYSNQYILNMTISDLLVGFIMAIRSIVYLYDEWIFGQTLLNVFIAVLNVLILIAFHIEKKLRTYTNQYILNITISDLLVGFVMAIRIPCGVMENSTLVISSEPANLTLDSTDGSVVVFSLLFSLSAMTVAMNALILRAFHIERKLRTYSNQYILNITISDLLIYFTVKASGSRSLWKRFNLKTMNKAEGDTNTQFQSDTTNDISLTEPHDQSLDNDDGTRIDINASGVQNDDTVVNVHNQQGIIYVQQETDTKDTTPNQPNSICSCRPSKDDPRTEDPETLSRQLNSRSDPSQEISTRRIAGPTPAKDSRMKPSHLSSSNNNKVMRTLTLITVAFFLTWLPSSVAIIALDFKSKMPAGVTEFVRWASYSNSLINPITYAIAQPLVRQTIWRIWLWLHAVLIITSGSGPCSDHVYGSGSSSDHHSCSGSSSGHMALVPVLITSMALVAILIIIVVLAPVLVTTLALVPVLITSMALILQWL
eukprot:XP_011666782.1 PREDICTED: histamine H1 receptor-like [Strongylocentrotus purpuratus]